MNSSCLIIAGEKSGEEHCLSFFKELKMKCKETDFFGVGGDELEREGLQLLYHLKDFSSWGFSEVIGKIPFYIKALKNIEQKVIEKNCQTAILIDFQDFNLRLAKKLKKRGVNVLYYVAPQAWAWKEYRAKVLEECVHTLFTIIPFEKKWFKDRGVSKILAIEHPLMTTYIKDLPLTSIPKGISGTIKLLCLPGSRNFEVDKLLPEFVKVVRNLRLKYQVKASIVLSPNVNKEIYKPYLTYFEYQYPSDKLSKALINADMALAASGTVTLATALFEVPTVVCYKASLLNEFIYNTFISYKGPISLANIVHERMVFPELIQNQATSFNMQNKLEDWIISKENYKKTKELLAYTRNLIKGDGENLPQYFSDVIEHHG